MELQWRCSCQGDGRIHPGTQRPLLLTDPHDSPEGGLGWLNAPTAGPGPAESHTTRTYNQDLCGHLSMQFLSLSLSVSLIPFPTAHLSFPPVLPPSLSISCSVSVGRRHRGTSQPQSIYSLMVEDCYLATGYISIRTSAVYYSHQHQTI